MHPPENRETEPMKPKTSKERDKMLHHLLETADTETGSRGLTDHEARRLSRYRNVLERLEAHEEMAPHDFAPRVMAALPDRRRSTWADRLKPFWPEKRFWPIPLFSGALAMLVLVTGFMLFRIPSKTLLVPMVFDLYAPSAKQVELVGTFSHWMPKAFTLKGPDAVGYWAIAVRLPPGRYEYAFLINGSQVVQDDDGEALRADGLGRENSLLLLRTAPPQLDRRYGFTPDEFVAIPGNDRDARTSFLPDVKREQWQSLLDDAVAAGVPREAMEGLVDHMAVANLNPHEARAMLEPLLQEAHAGHSLKPIFLKIHEGILKKASPKTIKSLAQKRSDAYKKARALLFRTGHGPSTAADPTLLDTTAFALESSPDPASLEDILTAAKGKSPDRIAAVIEACETLQYDGLEPEPLRLILKDCLQKNLGTQQIQRVLQRIEEELRKGADPMTLRNELWVKSI